MLWRRVKKWAFPAVIDMHESFLNEHGIAARYLPPRPIKMSLLCGVIGATCSCWLILDIRRPLKGGGAKAMGEHWITITMMHDCDWLRSPVIGSIVAWIVFQVTAKNCGRISYRSSNGTNDGLLRIVPAMRKRHDEPVWINVWNVRTPGMSSPSLSEESCSSHSEWIISSWRRRSLWQKTDTSHIQKDIRIGIRR